MAHANNVLRVFKGAVEPARTSPSGNEIKFWKGAVNPTDYGTIPDVVGEVQATAETNITNAGFVVGDVTTANSDSVPAGSVISQDPTTGEATLESSVDLVVSLGPLASSSGRSKRKRYVVEVDGNYIQVASVQEAESVLMQVRQLAEESASRDVQTEITPKPPRISVKTISGKASTSKTIQSEVKRTQKVINRAYIRAAEAIAQNREISELIIQKIRDEDDEAIIALLL